MWNISIRLTIYDNGACPTEEDCFNNFNKKENCYPTFGLKNVTKIQIQDGIYRNILFLIFLVVIVKEKFYSGKCFSFGYFQKEVKKYVDISNENKEIRKHQIRILKF